MMTWKEKLAPVTVGRSPAHVLAAACKALRFAPRTVVEVGVYEGANARRLRRMLKPEMLYLIDPWCVTKTTGKYNLKYLEPGAWDLLFSKIREEFAGPDVSIIRAKSAQGVSAFRAGGLDLVYIDGDHRYPYIRDDIEMWYPKVKPGGILAGHDFSATRRSGSANRVRDAVLERFGWEGIWTGQHRVWLHVKDGEVKADAIA